MTQKEQELNSQCLFLEKDAIPPPPTTTTSGRITNLALNNFLYLKLLFESPGTRMQCSYLNMVFSAIKKNWFLQSTITIF